MGKYTEIFDSITRENADAKIDNILNDIRSDLNEIERTRPKEDHDLSCMRVRELQNMGIVLSIIKAR